MNDDETQIIHQNPLPIELCLGVIAGGHSTRWASDITKCLSDFRGQTMTEHFLNTTQLPIQGICIRPEQYAIWQSYQLPYSLLQENRSDLPEGPLKGIHCLLSSLTPNQSIIITPCDMPLLTDEVLSILWQTQQTTQTTHPILLTYASGKHTPVCLLSSQLLTSLEQYLLSGQQKLIRWLVQEDAISVAWLGDQSLLANLNSHADFDQVNRF